MSVMQRTVEQIIKAHVSVLEQALEKILKSPRFTPENLTRLEIQPTPEGVLRRSAIRHDPSGFVLYVVETTMDAEGFHSRGWIPEGGEMPT